MYGISRFDIETTLKVASAENLLSASKELTRWNDPRSSFWPKSSGEAAYQVLFGANEFWPADTETIGFEIAGYEFDPEVGFEEGDTCRLKATFLITDRYALECYLEEVGGGDSTTVVLEDDRDLLGVFINDLAASFGYRRSFTDAENPSYGLQMQEIKVATGSMILDRGVTQRLEEIADEQNHLARIAV